jgi:GH25 family lysozyme M1 (1,4-beta-N-acetylmuramidase)
MDVRLPDVSSYQGMVDWAQVLGSGRAGGIVKASEGMNFIDGQFIRNWNALGDLKAVRGCYHFARPGSSLPAQQAQKFLGVVRTWKPTDLLILDLEVGDGNLSSWALGWLHEVQSQTGIVPWLYSYGPFIRQHLTDPALAAFPLWLAAYQDRPPACPPPWKTYQLWQHTDKATIPGIGGQCDESVGTLDQPASPAPTQAVKPMYDPPIPPIAAAWLDDQGRVISAVSVDGNVYWGKWWGNVSGKPYWGNRKAATIGPRPDGQPGYRITATSGENYDLPDGLDRL